MQYREELERTASNFYQEYESKKIQIMDKIQLHAVNQIKEGYTSFKIVRLNKDDEKFLKEWADTANASVKIVKFHCFENEKKYLIKQFIVDLRKNIEANYSLEGKMLIMTEVCR